MNVKHITTAQLASLTAEATQIILASPPFKGVAETELLEDLAFDLASGHTGRSKARATADWYLNRIVWAYTQNASIPPSEESKAWSSMEGGHVLFDDRAAKKMAQDLAGKLGIMLK